MEHFNPDFMRIKGSIDNLCVLAHLVHVAPPDGPPELSGNYNAEHSLVAFIINPHGPTPSIYTPALLRLRRVARDGRYDPGVPATRSSDGSFLFCGTPGVRKPSPRTLYAPARPSHHADAVLRPLGLPQALRLALRASMAHRLKA